ncbi:E3 ubiquitin-protein ligase BRE1 [Nosema granulosis]|uniref:E3 ubiquitin protein ligase n=1 Tax=Nosema granulosis TaxID=83296 RepID=A0A9P6H000_9MICR|nr:E3 ubiquitin-protein ligase BRE1 [Nosema granulosis]
MNRKKFKEDYNVKAVINKLSNVLIEENLINKQKCLIYLKYKTFSELFQKEKEKNRKLEEELTKLYQKESTEDESNTQKDSNAEEENKENIVPTNSDIVNVDLNTLEFNYGESFDNQRSSLLIKDKKSLFSKLSELREALSAKDRKIIELENKVIKLQIIRRCESNIPRIENGPSDVSQDELIDLKAKLEYQRVENEREKRELNSKLKEYFIKYEESIKKYSQCYEQLSSSLLNLENIRKFHMSKETKKIKNMSLLNSQIKEFVFLITDLENKVSALNLIYSDLQEYTSFVEAQNKDLHNRIKAYSLLSERLTVKTGDDFFDQEISNLLEVCDSLTEENKKLYSEIGDLQSQVDLFRRSNHSMKQENDLHRLREDSYTEDVQKYLQNIRELTQSVQDVCLKLEESNLDRNKLTKLNVDRISCIEKYKEDLRNKAVENAILEGKYKESCNQIEDYYKKFEDRLRSRKPSQEDTFVVCNLCDANSKNVALVSCMHTFCNECIDTRIKLRNRRCPTCGTPFGSNDVKKFYI